MSVFPAIMAGAAAFGLAVATAPSSEHVQPVAHHALPNAGGNALSAVVVAYAPGGTSRAHHHAGSVFAYVLAGHIRSRNSATGPERIYGPGESFFEPAGSTHLISANASATEPARLLAVFVAPANATLTVPER